MGFGPPPLFRQRLRTPFSEMMELVRSREVRLDFSESSSVVESWEKRLVTLWRRPSTRGGEVAEATELEVDRRAGGAPRTALGEGKVSVLSISSSWSSDPNRGGVRPNGSGESSSPGEFASRVGLLIGDGVFVTRWCSPPLVPSAVGDAGRLLVLIGVTEGVALDGALPSLELLVDHLDGCWWIWETVLFAFDCVASSPLSTVCQLTSRN